jgi:hypothetical protein
MDNEKRTMMPPVPDDYENLLSPLQLMALRNIAHFGWKLRFVRREGVDIPVPVVNGADGKAIGVIDEDGNLDPDPDIQLRE